MAAKRITQTEMKAQMDDMQLSLQRVDSMLILARRLLAESVADTVRVNRLESLGVQELSFPDVDVPIVGTLRETIDRLAAV